MKTTAFITGANRGIGLALTEKMLKKGYCVWATYRKEEKASDLLELAEFFSQQTHVLALDITREEMVLDVVETLKNSPMPHLDVLINNAGIFPGERDELFEDVKIEHFSQAYETNVVGTARVTQSLLPYLRKGHHSRIINISSGAGSISEKEDHLFYCYATSKAALNMFTRALAAELKKEGICVVSISPGWVKTDMGGANALLTAEESASRLVETIDKLTLNESGKFLGPDGNEGEYQW